MITIKEWMELVDYKITEGGEYGWDCYGGGTASVFQSWLIPEQVQPILLSDYPYIAEKNSICKPTNASRV